MAWSLGGMWSGIRGAELRDYYYKWMLGWLLCLEYLGGISEWRLIDTLQVAAATYH